jgi:putative ABC transport system permease protein
MTNAVRSYPQLNLVVRAADPMAAVPPSLRVVQELGAGRPVRNVQLLEDYVQAASSDTRFALFVIGVLAVLAIVLAAVGVYAVVAYAMTRRRRELAVRSALGASRKQLVALILREGAIWTFAGLAAGLAGAAALSGVLESLLFRVGRHDVVTFTVVATLLTVVGLAASAIPAWRSARVDPNLALRCE